jgi:hypothetical protein
MPRTLDFIGIGALATLIPFMAVDLAATEGANPPPVAPRVHVFDPAIVWPADDWADPQLLAWTQPVEAIRTQRCEQAAFYVVHLSGTGLETSHFAAGSMDDVVNSWNGCSLYLWYGDHYDAEANAQAVEDAITRLNPSGEPKPVVLAGASFGGIAAEAIAADPVIRDSAAVDVKGIIMESTPYDLADVKGDGALGVVTQLGIGLVDLENPSGDYLPVIASNLLGRPLNEINWEDTWRNITRTWPRLMWTQVAGIRAGMTQTRELPVVYISSSDDNTVNVAQAEARIRDALGDVTGYSLDEPVPHAGCWLHTYHAECSAVFQDALISILERTPDWDWGYLDDTLGETSVTYVFDTESLELIVEDPQGEVISKRELRPSP